MTAGKDEFLFPGPEPLSKAAFWCSFNVNPVQTASPIPGRTTGRFPSLHQNVVRVFFLNGTRRRCNGKWHAGQCDTCQMQNLG